MLDNERQTELVESIVNLVLYLKEEQKRGTSENFLKFCCEPKIKKKNLLKIKVYKISKGRQTGVAQG